MNWIADHVIKWKKRILVITALLTVVMAVCALQVKINYNMSDYLPEDANSTKAITVMSENFNESMSNANVMVRGVTIDEALEYKDEITALEHVEDVGWIDQSMDPEQLKRLIKDDGTINRDYVDETTIKTIEGYYKDGNALFQVTIESGYEQDTVNEIYDIIGDDNAMIGSAVEQAASQNLAITQSIKAIMILAPLIILVLILSTQSWIEPFLYLTTIGVAAVINLGLCLIRGEISYVTLAVAPILQLAVSLDYAVFLSHSFSKYRNKKMSINDAMKLAMKDSLKAISASCLTTLFGFVALLFMNFKIGPDMGISLVLGVILSFLAVMIFLPALMLVTYKLNDKCMHRPLLPKFDKLGNVLVKLRFILLILAVVVILPSFNKQGDNTFIYGSGEPAAESRLAKDTTAVENVFGKSNMVAILVPRGNEEAETELAEKFADLEYVDSVMSYANVIGFDTPEEMLPEGAADSFYSDQYARIILSTTLDTEGEKSFAAVEEIEDLVERYYDADDVYMCGNSVNMYDMKVCIEDDNARVGIITLVAIFIILLLEFKSLIIPVILILVVKSAIWITMALSAITGEAVCYMGYLVVSTVMMGATIDYAILITDEYIKNRRTKTSLNAMKSTLSSGIKSILVSASTLAIAGFSLGLTSSESIVKLLGMMLGKGAVVAFVLSITMLPAILVIFDRLLPLLSLKLHFYKEGDVIDVAVEEETSNISRGLPITESYCDFIDDDTITCVENPERTVICINREYGSGGRAVAQAAAKKLGIKYVDHIVLEKAIEKTGIDMSMFKDADEKKRRDMLFSVIYEGNDERYYGKSANDVLFDIQRRAILDEVKANDCIIVGRCAGDLIRKYTNVKSLYMFISADKDCRIKRVSSRNNISMEVAKIEVEKTDKERQEYYKYYTKKDWKDPDMYDVILNTTIVGEERVAAIIVDSYTQMKEI